MPFTVITLRKVPDSLRGDLTRWMQEIATGVYVGNFNSRIREYLWKRVTDTIGRGEATLSYSCRNEIGYSFCTFNTERQKVDYEGIPLVLVPSKEYSDEKSKEELHGFSIAGKYYRAKRKKINGGDSVSKKIKDEETSEISDSVQQLVTDLVFLDIETTGLDVDTNEIIEIGAVKITDGNEILFHRLIRSDIHIPDVVRNMTGITDDMLKNGESLENSIKDLNDFIRGAVLSGYNISFDIRFLNRALENFSLEPIHNKTLELMNEAKRKNSFQPNYKFETTLKEYGITERVLHRALDDAKLMYRLYEAMGIKL